jgi:hypothetical protein
MLERFLSEILGIERVQVSSTTDRCDGAVNRRAVDYEEGIGLSRRHCRSGRWGSPAIIVRGRAQVHMTLWTARGPGMKIVSI